MQLVVALMMIDDLCIAFIDGVFALTIRPGTGLLLLVILLLVLFYYYCYYNSTLMPE